MRSVFLQTFLGITLVFSLSFPIVGVAHATTPKSNDKIFLLLLNSNNYYYGSDRTAIKLAKDMCNSLRKAPTRQGKTRTARTIGSVMRLSGWSFDKGNAFISTAVSVYCPGQQGAVGRGWATGYLTG